eukprot:867946-Rhodomonas_salina.4
MASNWDARVYNTAHWSVWSMLTRSVSLCHRDCASATKTLAANDGTARLRHSTGMLPQIPELTTLRVFMYRYASSLSYALHDDIELPCFGSSSRPSQPLAAVCTAAVAI